MTIKFAATEPASGGIGAFNLNLKSFLFQLATFVIVLLVLRRWVFPKLTATLEARRTTLEESLVKAKQAEEALARAEAKAAEIIQTARRQADKSLAEASAQAKDIVNEAAESAKVQTQRLLAESQQRLSQEKIKLREELKDELADLVVTTTEKVLQRKLDEQEDSRLIEQAVREVRV